MQEAVLIAFVILTFLTVIVRRGSRGDLQQEVVTSQEFSRCGLHCHVVPSWCHAPCCSLQRTYFSVYLLAVFSDWLKGPYIYRLYSWHGHSDSTIALLYVTGFASSAVFGALTGPAADIYGRR